MDTFSRMMHRQGGVPNNEAVVIKSANPALLVDTTAHVVQSKNKNLVILAFGGTDYRNIVHMMADVSTRMDQFSTTGQVHGGFYRSALVAWPTLKQLLHFALDGSSLCEAAASERDKTLKDLCGTLAPRCDNAPAADRHAGDDEPAPPGAEEESKPGLYITGHSLGGALAVITAALIYHDPEAKPIWDKLRAIYTYGQPRAVHRDFAAQLEKPIGSKVFRHVYKRDIVPSLPPWSTGSFSHIGTEFHSTEGGWLLQRNTVNQAFSVSASLLFGLVSPILDQLGGLPWLRWVFSPFSSLGDHSPINYLRTSLIAAPGTEFM
ncbi:lipase family protein [Sorangium sp. So ce426]|uniref:lipase family protein n=1 Tax=Sorangium sp. So ce426 TaxID=3133312 RepID=UPI003F5BAD45